MAPDDLDRNLLFGVLALKADVFDAPRFTKFCAAWAGQKETSLADWLVKRGWISVEDRIAVDHLVELKVRKHGSVQIGLADAMDAEVMQALQNVDDTKIRRFATGLAVLGEPERARSVAPVAETLYTATKPQLTGPGNEIAASAMVRGSIPLTEGDQLQLPRQRRGLFRILATVGATTVVVGLVCLAGSQMRLAEANKRTEQYREQLDQRDQQAREYLALAREAVDDFQSRVHNDPQFKERNLDLWRQAVLKNPPASSETKTMLWLFSSKLSPSRKNLSPTTPTG